MSDISEQFGRFQIQRRLFGDGFSEGYQARADEGDVILKVASAELSQQAWYQEVFSEGAELNQLVDHTNVFPALASGIVDGQCWLAFRFLDGRTVRQVLHELNQQHVMLPTEYAVYIALQVCQALEYLHGLKDGGGRPARVVHQDIAPGTLHLAFDGTVRLLDAGMVRAAHGGDPELATAQLGRPAYFGPERIKGSRPTPRSDVYALGVVLWELLAGRRLFAGTEREEIMAEVLVGEVVPPSEHNPDVPAELDALVMKAIDRRVLRRYAGATAFREALKEYLAKSPIRSLKAGVSGVMDTLFGEERLAEAALPTRSPRDVEHAIATGRIGEFADNFDLRPGPGQRGASAEPWVKAEGGLGPLSKAALGLVALGVLGGGAWYVHELTSSASDVPQIADAADLVDELRQRNPGAADPDGLHTAKGWDELRLGTPEAVLRARTEFELAVAADPHGPHAVAGLALVYAQLGDQQLQLDAADLISRAEKLPGGEESILRAKAGVALASGNYGSAEVKGRECLSAHPEDGLCSWYLGDTLLALGRYGEALSQLQAALQTITHSPGLHQSLGQAAMLSGDFAGAESALGKAVKLLPNEPSVHIALADLHRRTGRWDEALTSIDRVLEVDPRHVRARYLKGVILLHVAGEAEAASELLGALAEDPVLSGNRLALDAIVQACFASLAAGRVAEAERYADRALDRDPDHPMARLGKALALDAGGDADGSEEALKGADTGQLRGREQARWHYHAALLYTRHDHQRFARLSLEQALTADPLWVPPQLVLAMVEMRMGEGREGLRRLENTWQLDIGGELGRDPIMLAPVGLMAPSEMWSALDEVLPDKLSNRAARSRVRGLLEAHTCLSGGDCSKAVKLLTPVVSAAPEDVAARVFLAQAQAAEGDLQEALINLRYVASESAPSTVYALLGSLYAQLDMVEEARLAYDEAEARPDRTPALQRRRAQLEVIARETKQAEIYARKARALDPDDLIAAGILLETAAP